MERRQKSGNGHQAGAEQGDGGEAGGEPVPASPIPDGGSHDLRSLWPVSHRSSSRIGRLTVKDKICYL
jgi:hypothetical protein